MARIVSILGGLMMLIALIGVGWGILNTQQVAADAKTISAAVPGAENTADVAETGARFVSARSAVQPPREVAPMPTEPASRTGGAEAQTVQVTALDPAVPSARDRAATALAAAMRQASQSVDAPAAADSPPSAAEFAAAVSDTRSALARLEAQRAAELTGKLNLLGDRCWDSVVFHQPFDTDGLEPISEETIDYDDPSSRQSWRDPETGLVVVYQTSEGYGTDRPLRHCAVKTDYRKDAQSDEIVAFASGLDGWFEARGLAGSFAPYERESHANQQSRQSRHGSAGGCPITVNFFHRDLMGREMRFEIKESQASICDARPFAAPGEVRVNRLVQVNR